MKSKQLIMIIILTGLIALTNNCFSDTWSAASRPGDSTKNSFSAPTTSLSKTGTEFAPPTRSFRCQPVSSILRPQNRARTETFQTAAATMAEDQPAPAGGVQETANETATSADNPPAISDAESPVIIEGPEPKNILPEVSTLQSHSGVETLPTPVVSNPVTPTKSSSSYGQVPPYFIRNDGQIDPAVKYYVKGPRGTVYLTNSEIVFDFLQENSGPKDKPESTAGEPGKPAPERDEKKTFTRLVFRQQFKDSNPEVSVEGNKELPGKINYFVGNKSNWHSNIPTVEEVIYHNLYPGIDLNCFFEGANIRYQYTVNPGSDPGNLVLEYVGIDGLEVKSSGEMIVITPFGGFMSPAPKITQAIEEKEIEIKGEFNILNDNNVTYKIGPYNKQYPIIIR